MGFGDDLMVTALASELKKKYPDRQIVIGNVKKKAGLSFNCIREQSKHFKL